MEVPVVCPFCWDHAIYPIHEVKLIAETGGSQRPLGEGKIFRCRDWHVFAVFPRTFMRPLNSPSDPNLL